jgi:hypothetical protein
MGATQRRSRVVDGADLVRQLKELANMHACQDLTDDEFTRAKAYLLGRA